MKNNEQHLKSSRFEVLLMPYGAGKEGDLRPQQLAHRKIVVQQRPILREGVA